MASSPSVLIIILNWNGERDTVDAVESVGKIEYPNAKVLVVDNGSRPESLAFIRAHCPDVKCLQTGSNLGYAGGNNVGLRVARERGFAYALVLNNDMTVDPSVLTRLINAAESDPSIAVLGPRVYRHDKPEEPFYTGWKIDWRRWLFHRVPLASPEGTLADVDFVQGCALLLRMSFASQYGGFDERYHLYCEDADLCVRATRAGFRVAEDVKARAWHKGYGSSGRNSPLKLYYSIRNRFLFISRHAPRANRFLLRAQLLAETSGHTLRAAGGLLSGNRHGESRALRAIGRALLDSALGRYGAGPSWLFQRAA